MLGDLLHPLAAAARLFLCSEVTGAVTAQLGVEALARQTQHLCGGGAIVAGDLQRRLDLRLTQQSPRLQGTHRQTRVASKFTGAGRLKCGASP